MVDAKRHAVNLTYRESRTLSRDGLQRIQQLEQETAEPIVVVFSAGVAAGVFDDVDARLVVQNLLLVSHAWALKHWNLGGFVTLDEYIDQQFVLLLKGVRASSSA